MTWDSTVSEDSERMFEKQQMLFSAKLRLASQVLMITQSASWEEIMTVLIITVSLSLTSVLSVCPPLCPSLCLHRGRNIIILNIYLHTEALICFCSSPILAISSGCSSRYREFGDTNPQHLADLTPTWPERHKNTWRFTLRGTEMKIWT